MVVQQTIRTAFSQATFLQTIRTAFSQATFLQTIRTAFSQAAFLQTIRTAFSQAALLQTIRTAFSQATFQQTIRTAFGHDGVSKSAGSEYRESEAKQELAFHECVLRVIKLGCCRVWVECYALHF